MERIEAFEKMLADLQEQAEAENQKMAELKAAGKEKTEKRRPRHTGSISVTGCSIKRCWTCIRNTG